MSMERLLVLSEENRVNIVKCKCRKKCTKHYFELLRTAMNK